MTMMFHVFVEGAKDGSPGGVRQLAEAIAAHYGLPVAELLERLAQGRLRVKGNIDRATAERYVADLERLGARCTIEPSTPQTSRLATPLPFPAVRTTTPPGPFASGLSAAFAGESKAADLGALGEDAAPLALASVDGSDASGPVAVPGFEPPAKVAPPPTPKQKPKPKPKDEPIDMFAPPDALAEFKVELAPEEAERDARRRASVPPPVSPPAPAPAPPTPQLRRPSTPSLRPPPVTVAPPRLLGDPRKRLIAGVALAIGLGFVPAHFVAAMREHAAQDAAAHELAAAAQQPLDQPAIDALWRDQRARLDGDRVRIALLGLAIWGALGAGIAYLWFRKIPWSDT
ncbi:MAG TPA: hypothetical protein VLX92_09355 [Kofleriaceae bacterium]|nr:hypothetical protein [Kofleriaceae bacterium]